MRRGLSHLFLLFSRAQRIDPPGLHLGLFRRLGDIAGDGYRHLRMERYPHGMEAQGFDRPLEDDLASLYRETCLGDRLRDVARLHRAIQLSALARLTDEEDGQAL